MLLYFNKRPLFWSSLYFCLGIISAFYLQGKIILILLFFYFLFVFTFYFFKKISIIIILIIIFISGFFYMYSGELKYYRNDSTASYNNKGVVTVIAEVKKDLSSLQGKHYYLKPLIINENNINHGLIQLNKNQIEESLKNGDLIRIKLDLRKPPSATEPGSFCYYSYLRKQGIYSLGYVNNGYHLLARKQYPLKNIIIRIKNYILKEIDDSLNYPYNEIIKALLLGERDNLPGEWRDRFSRGGVNHLLAISGLHIGFIVLILVFIINCLKIPDLYRNITISFFMLLYIMIAGAAASVIRAGILSVLFLWAPFFKRRGDIFNLLGLTAIINLIYNPYSIFTAGFQLTYIVLITIILWTDILSKYFYKPVAVSIAAQMGSIPLTAFYFNQISPVAVLSNLWAIPLTAIIIFIAFITFFFGWFSSFITGISTIILEIMLSVLNKGILLMSNIPGGFLEVASPSINLIFIYYFYIICLSYLMRKRIIPFNRHKKILRIKFLMIFTIIVILIYIFKLN